MKCSLVAFALTTLVALAGSYPLEEYRDTITNTLGNDWSASIDGDAIVITSKFTVYRVGLISRSGEPPLFKESTSRRELSKEAEPERYVIRLEYAPWPGHDEVQRRLIERQRLAGRVEEGAPTKDEWGQRVSELSKVRIPRYMAGWGQRQYGVYRVMPPTMASRIYPPSAVAKIGAAKELLDVVMPNLITNYRE